MSLQADPEATVVATARELSTTDTSKANHLVSTMMRLDQTEYSRGGLSTMSRGGEESKLSIASVLLTLLVGLLELGAPKRSADEEEAFTLLAPALKDLSEANGPATRLESTAAVWSELSEMASHANALIAARSAPTFSECASEEVTDPFLRQFVQAKQDLASSEPPVRARGVVALRHLTFAVGPSLSIEGEQIDRKIDMTDVMYLAIDALKDKESYVFLAAIQTIATGATQQPTSVVRNLCAALACGVCPSRDGHKKHLAAEQRVKIAEALIAFVRRCASLNEHLDGIMGALFHDTKQNGRTMSPDKSEMIQAETHRYFIGADKEEDETGDKWEQTRLRVNTGGPVFDNEEDHLVRAAAINLVSEVALFASPAALSRFGPLLVECAKMALQLEAARPLRRSGAYLASSLYNVVLREIEGQDPKLLSKQQLECPFSVAMVSSDEESLAAMVSRVEQGNDLMDLEEENGRRYDPATVARCKETLEARQHVIDSGIFALAKLSVDRRKEYPSVFQIHKDAATKINDASPLISIVKDV